MNQVTLLKEENKKLRAVNERVVKKRQKQKSYIRNRGVLSVADAQEAQGVGKSRVEQETIAVENSNITGSVRASRMCSVCRSIEHTARTCPER
jgi:hypothetical protein